MPLKSAHTLAAVIWLAASDGNVIGQPATRPAASPTTVASQAADLERAAADLADARWQVRQQASYTLLDAGWQSLPALRRAYHRTRSHEVRLRIRELVEGIYSARAVPARGGFLGIRQRPRYRLIDPRVPAGVMWVEVLQVFRDTAADRAGLRPGDLITRCNGTPFVEDPTGQAFSSIVSQHKVGEEVTLEVHRGADGPTTITVKLGHRPMAVLAEADPESYARIHTAFDAWWRDEFIAAATGRADPAAPTSQPSAR